MSAPKRVARATIARLPRYLSYLEGLDEHVRTVSSQQLADGAAVKDAIVRRDMSDLGITGTRGVGYEVADLTDHLHRKLGGGVARNVVIVGAGHLGLALANYAGFGSAGFNLVGIYDANPDLFGNQAGEARIADVANLEKDLADTPASLGIVTVPAGAAQDILDRLVSLGVKSILSFAPTTLSHADDVDVRHVDLATELQVLAYFAK